MYSFMSRTCGRIEEKREPFSDLVQYATIVGILGFLEGDVDLPKGVSVTVP